MGLGVRALEKQSRGCRARAWPMSRSVLATETAFPRCQKPDWPGCGPAFGGISGTQHTIGLSKVYFLSVLHLTLLFPGIGPKEYRDRLNQEAEKWSKSKDFGK